MDTTITTIPAGNINVYMDGVGFDRQWVNLLLLGSQAFARQPAAWPTDADDYLFFYESTGSGAQLAYYDASSNLLDNPGVLIPNSSDSQYLKYIIAHEFGHLLEYKIHCSAGGGDCDNVGAYAMQANYDFNATACEVNGTDASHYYNSGEYQSAAAIEGWAHYVAAFAYNIPSQSTCRVQPNQTIPWNYGSGGSTDSPFSCEGAETGGDFGGAEFTFPSTPVQGRDLYGQFCTGDGTTNVGTEVDWLRYWWDFNQASGMSFLKATQVIELMESNTWCAQTSPCSVPADNLPSERLEDAMAAQGWTTLYNAIKDNGVER